jgi:opacity protein-like surface antigen
MRQLLHSYSRLSILFLLSLSLAIVLPAWSAEHIVTPSVQLSETYDDHVFFENVDDFEHRVTPALKLDARTDRAQWQTSAAWDISEYQRHSELNTVDQTYGFSAAVAPGDLWRFNLAGQYVDDYTFRSALEETGIVAKRSKRKSGKVQPGAAFLLDSRNTLALTYEFTKTQYQLEGYPDYEVHGLNVSWFHDLLNERTRVIWAVSADQADFEDPDGDVKQRTYRALAGLDHRFTEKLQFRLTAGARYTESEFPRTESVFIPPDSIEVTTKTEEEEDSGFIVDGALKWGAEKLSLSASVSRDVTPSIYGEIITRNRVSCGLTYQWSEKLRGGLSAAYYLSETDGVVRQQEWETYTVGPSMTYTLTPDINLQLGYGYTHSEDQDTDRSQDRNRAFVQLTMAWPKHMD